MSFSELFNPFGEFILRELEASTEVMAIKSHIVNNIYLNDRTLYAESDDGFQMHLNLIGETSAKHGLEINTKEAKCIFNIKKRFPVQKCHLNCNKQGIDQVERCSYLRSLVTADRRR